MRPLPASIAIREAAETDRSAVSELLSAAFGRDEGPVVVQLVRDLLEDPTARPLLPLVAVVEGEVVGYVLFTKVRIDPAGSDGAEASGAILAPLAVHPRFQGRGIGGRLVREGLRRLAATGAEWIFVLGHPGYYPRFGFREAGVQGFHAPHAIPEEQAAAWMVLPLVPVAAPRLRGRVVCADSLLDLRHWRE